MSDDDEAVERCSSAPVIKWLELNQNNASPIISRSFKPIKQTSLQQPDSVDECSNDSNNAKKSLRLRRHSSLTRGVLQRVRTNSEADERAGEAKINTSFSLNSSTERLHLSPNPGVSPGASSNSGGAFFRPIGSPNSVFDSPGSASPESRCDYPLRSRQQPGRQMFKPGIPASRKRSSRNSMDTDDGHAVQSSAIKRIKLDLDWSETDRTVSNDSGNGEDPNVHHPSINPYDWWGTDGANQFRERIRRMSSESSISIDSITKEFSLAKESK